MDFEPSNSTQEEILCAATQYNLDILRLEDRGKICKIYPDVGDEVQTKMLAAELKENLRDKKGRRTSNFQQLVELGLLRKQSTTHFPLAGHLLLTPKGADLLGISYEDFLCVPEILEAEKKYKNAVEKALTDWESNWELGDLCKKIISSVPDFGDICPPIISPIHFLREIMGHIAKGYRINLISVPGNSVDKINYETALNIGKMLGWFPQESSMKDQRSFGNLLTEKGKVYMDAFREMIK